VLVHRKFSGFFAEFFQCQFEFLFDIFFQRLIRLWGERHNHLVGHQYRFIAGLVNGLIIQARCPNQRESDEKSENDKNLFHLL